MKNIHASLSALLFLSVALPVLAETTVTVDNNKVTVNQSTGIAAIPQAVPQMVIVRQVPMVITNEEALGEFQGRVVEVNLSQNQIVVHDATGKDRQVSVTQGTINSYRLGDYVRVGPATAPLIITQEAITGDFEGRIVEVNYTQNLIAVRDANGRDRQVPVKLEYINNYRVGDYVQIRPMADLTIIKMEESPKDFEGVIIRVDVHQSQIVVRDTIGRERRVTLKQGMIGTYKTDDYVQIHLAADLKEAITVNTIGDIRKIEGHIVGMDYPRSRMVVRDSHGRDTTILVRQWMVNNYRIGDNARIYLLANRDDAQLINIFR